MISRSEAKGSSTSKELSEASALSDSILKAIKVVSNLVTAQNWDFWNTKNFQKKLIKNEILKISGKKITLYSYYALIIFVVYILLDLSWYLNKVCV